MSDQLDYESADSKPPAEGVHYAHEVRGPRGELPYGWVSVSCGAGTAALGIVALTGHGAPVWCTALALIPPVQVVGLMMGWQAWHHSRRQRRVGLVGVVLNLLGVALGAAFVVVTWGVD